MGVGNLTETFSQKERSIGRFTLERLKFPLISPVALEC
jgi:hypothetical protein